MKERYDGAPAVEAEEINTKESDDRTICNEEKSGTGRTGSKQETSLAIPLDGGGFYTSFTPIPS